MGGFPLQGVESGPVGPHHVFVGVEATLMVAMASEERPGGVVVLGYHSALAH